MACVWMGCSGLTRMADTPITPASLTVLGARPRGRPKVLEPLVPMTTWVPMREYDRLVRMASTNGQPLSSLVRDLLAISRKTG
jgi:hypothetical protein